MISETVAGASPVCSPISTRETGPLARSASITWSRFSDRIEACPGAFAFMPEATAHPPLNPYLVIYRTGAIPQSFKGSADAIGLPEDRLTPTPNPNNFDLRTKYANQDGSPDASGSASVELSQHAVDGRAPNRSARDTSATRPDASDLADGAPSWSDHTGKARDKPIAGAASGVAAGIRERTAPVYRVIALDVGEV